MEKLESLFWRALISLFIFALLRNCSQYRTQQKVVNPPYNPYAQVRFSNNNGVCDCPYDIAIDGSYCGDRSAWSQNGGRVPLCFVGDRYGYPPN